MKVELNERTGAAERKRRLPKDVRRRQLLDVALRIVRNEGADRLTLGHLAERAGLSKPVVYDHFGTRSGLLIELYKRIDIERVNSFREAMATGERTPDDTVSTLATAYIRCSGDTTDEFYAVGAALAGSEEKAAVYQELLDNSVQMFVAVLEPFSPMRSDVLERCCVGLVGAGEALSAMLVRGHFTEAEATEALCQIIRTVLFKQAA